MKQFFKKQFTTWTGFVGRAWNWIWAIYMIFLAGINFYLSVVEHHAYASVAIWQLFAVFMWWLFHAVIRNQREMRAIYRDLDKSRDRYIEALEKEVRDQYEQIKQLRQHAS